MLTAYAKKNITTSSFCFKTIP